MHVRTLLITTPENEEAVLKEIMTRKYPLSSVREGYCQASVCRIIPLDIRIKEECVPQLLADLGAMDLVNEEGDGGKNIDHHILPRVRKTLKFLIKIFHKLIGHTMVKKEIKGNRFGNGWYYCINLGEQKDPRQNGVEEL